MNSAWKAAGITATSIIAGYMAIKGMDGWGWFLFVAVIIAGS